MPDIRHPCPPASGLCAHPRLQGKPYVEFLRDRLIPVEEKAKKYTLDNTEEECIAKIKVDKGLLNTASGKKADYLLIRCEHDIAYFVELKGCDVAKACEQILSTIDLLQNIVGSAQSINARIVCSRVSTPDIRSTPYIRLEKKKKKKNGTLLVRTRQYSEPCNG